MAKAGLGVDVLVAARARIARVFDDFPRIYVSFSGGKDSSVMLHLVMAEAIARERKVGVLFVDLEAQYELTIAHVAEMYARYADHIEPHWVALPLHLRNAVSQHEPHWVCWDPEREGAWVRRPHPSSVTNEERFGFFRRAMEFEEFVPQFGKWFGGGKLTACFVGIRSDESLNRYRTISGRRKSTFDGLPWTTWCGSTLYNAYPIYDWRTEDIWTYNARFDAPYNRLYDRMHQAGLSIHQARICQPYGDDQRRGLWLYSVIEPHTWAKVVARVCGANTGALYAHKTGNMMGRIKVTLPSGHTWESFTMLLLESSPPQTRLHFENKIAVFMHWWAERGHRKIPDAADPDMKLQHKKGGPSWERICKTLLKNDYWCKGLSFSQTHSHAYEKYMKLMKQRRQRWGGAA